jgi:hypothetical protein
LIQSCAIFDDRIADMNAISTSALRILPAARAAARRVVLGSRRALVSARTAAGVHAMTGVGRRLDRQDQGGNGRTGENANGECRDRLDTMAHVCPETRPGALG